MGYGVQPPNGSGKPDDGSRHLLPPENTSRIQTPILRFKIKSFIEFLKFFVGKLLGTLFAKGTSFFVIGTVLRLATTLPGISIRTVTILIPANSPLHTPDSVMSELIIIRHYNFSPPQLESDNARGTPRPLSCTRPKPHWWSEDRKRSLFEDTQTFLPTRRLNDLR